MINKIINEWTYQLDAGYPTKDSDYEVLRSVLQEMNILSEQEIDQTIRQAQGLYEQEPELENTQLLSEDDLRSDILLFASAVQLQPDTTSQRSRYFWSEEISVLLVLNHASLSSI